MYPEKNFTPWNLGITFDHNFNYGQHKVTSETVAIISATFATFTGTCR